MGVCAGPAAQGACLSQGAQGVTAFTDSVCTLRVSPPSHRAPQGLNQTLQVF